MNGRKHIIRPKIIQSSTDWKQGAIAKKHTPFFRAAMPLGKNWHWRSAILIGNDSTEYRLVVMYLPDNKRNYKAWLAMRVGNKDYALVCRYGSHGSHGGRHCHLLCGQEHYPIGEIEPKGLKSFPHHTNTTQAKLPLISRNEAWHWALKFYRIGVDSSGDLL